MLPGRMDGGWDGRTIMWGPGGAAGASWGSSSTMAACAALALNLIIFRLDATLSGPGVGTSHGSTESRPTVHE